MSQKKSVLLSSKPLPEVLACITASLTQRGCALCLLGCEQGGWLRMMTFYKSHGLKPLKLVASRRPVLWGDRCTAAFTSTSTVTIFIFNSVLLLFSLVWIYCAETSDASVVDSNFARSGVKRNDCVMRRGVTEKQQHITTTRTEWKKKWRRRAGASTEPRAGRTWRSSSGCACASSANFSRPSGITWGRWSSCRWVCDAQLTKSHNRPREGVNEAKLLTTAKTSKQPARLARATRQPFSCCMLIASGANPELLHQSNA